VAQKTVPVEAVRSDTAVRSENAVLAAEVWRRMLDFHMAHLRHMETARQLGLNPGATKLLLDLQPDDLVALPRPELVALRDALARLPSPASPGLESP